jgi:hypothetical protein
MFWGWKNSGEGGRGWRRFTQDSSDVISRLTDVIRLIMVHFKLHEVHYGLKARHTSWLGHWCIEGICIDEG